MLCHEGLVCVTVFCMRSPLPRTYPRLLPQALSLFRLFSILAGVQARSRLGNASSASAAKVASDSVLEGLLKVGPGRGAWVAVPPAGTPTWDPGITAVLSLVPPIPLPPNFHTLPGGAWNHCQGQWRGGRCPALGEWC